MFPEHYKTVSGLVATKTGRMHRFGLHPYKIQDGDITNIVYVNKELKSVLPPNEKFDDINTSSEIKEAKKDKRDFDLATKFLGQLVNA